MKNNQKVTILLSLLMGAFCGCSLEYFDHGDKCPPTGDGAKLSYIYDKEEKQVRAGSTEYSEYFEKSFCPSDYICAMDNKNEFFCQVRCGQTQVACNGNCIDPMSDNDYCGASNEGCDGYDCCKNAKRCLDSEFCSNGVCVTKSCKGDSCYYGMLFECVDGENEFKQMCDTNMCADEQKCSSATCEKNETKCMSGLLYTCKDGKSWKMEQCASAFCDSDGKKCGDITENACKGNEKVCLNSMAAMSCENGSWGIPVSCKYGELCKDGVCIAKADACTSSTCLANSDGYIYIECKNNIIQPLSYCLVGEKCDVSLGGCVECIPDESECRGDDFYRCDETGHWQIDHCGSNQRKCHETDGCYTCDEGAKECTADTYRVCENGVWNETKCVNMLCNENVGCYECTNGDAKCDALGVFYECRNYRWEKVTDCSEKKMACSEEKGCYNCEGNEKKCVDGVYMICKNGEFEVLNNCVEDEVKNRCDDNIGCYACDLFETKCSDGTFYKCFDQMSWKTEKCDKGQLCSEKGCYYQSMCNDAHTIYLEYDANNNLNKHYCMLENKYCDDEYGCVDAEYTCLEGGGHNILKLTAKDSGKSTTYNCKENTNITDADVLMQNPELGQMVLCNPNRGCAETYCDTSKHILYFADGPDKCKDYDQYCSNKYDECIECNIDNFTPFCFDSETYIYKCVYDSEIDMVEQVEDETCIACKSGKCTKHE